MGPLNEDQIRRLMFLLAIGGGAAVAAVAAAPAGAAALPLILTASATTAVAGWINTFTGEAAERRAKRLAGPKCGHLGHDLDRLFAGAVARTFIELATDEPRLADLYKRLAAYCDEQHEQLAADSIFLNVRTDRYARMFRAAARVKNLRLLTEPHVIDRLQMTKTTGWALVDHICRKTHQHPDDATIDHVANQLSGRLFACIREMFNRNPNADGRAFAALQLDIYGDLLAGLADTAEREQLMLQQIGLTLSQFGELRVRLQNHLTQWGVALEARLTELQADVTAVRLEIPRLILESEHRILNALHKSVPALLAAGAITREDIKALRSEAAAVSERVGRMQKDLTDLLVQTDPLPDLRLPSYPTSSDDSQSIQRYLFTQRRVPMFERERELYVINQFLDSGSTEHLWQFWQGGAGSGKSRLAHEVCLRRTTQGWYAGFLPRRYTKDADALDTRWLNKPLRRNALIVIDYVSHRIDAVATLLAAAYHHRNHWGVNGSRLKFLLLDRSRSTDWTDRITRLVNDNWEGWWRGEFPSPSLMRAPELGSEKTSAAGNAIAARQAFRFPNIIAPLRFEQDEVQDELRDLPFLGRAATNTVDYVWGEEYGPTSPEIRQALLDLTNVVDPSYRPLWCAMVAAVAARRCTNSDRPAPEIIRAIDRREVLDHVLRAEVQAWHALGFTEADLNLITLARLVDGLKFDPRHPEIARLIARGLVPAEPSDDLQAQLRGLSSNPSTDPAVFAAIEPDFLGECYVLAWFENDDAVSLPTKSRHKRRQDTPAVVSGAWAIGPEDTAWFLKLCFDNFGDEAGFQALRSCPLPDTPDARRWMAVLVAAMLSDRAEQSIADPARLEEALVLLDELESSNSEGGHEPVFRANLAMGLANLASVLANLAAQGVRPVDDTLRMLDRLETVYRVDQSDRTIRVPLSLAISNQLLHLGTVAERGEYAVGELLRLRDRIEKLYRTDESDGAIRRLFASALFNLAVTLCKLAAHHDYPTEELLRTHGRLQSLYIVDQNDPTIRELFAKSLVNLVGHLGLLAVERKFRIDDVLHFQSQLEELQGRNPDDLSIRHQLAVSLFNLTTHLAELTARGLYQVDDVLNRFALLKRLCDADSDDPEMRAQMTGALVNLTSKFGRMTAEARYETSDLLRLLAGLDKLYEAYPEDQEVVVEFAKGLNNAIKNLGALAAQGKYPLAEVMKLLARLENLSVTHSVNPLVRGSLAAGLYDLCRVLGEAVEQGTYPQAELIKLFGRLDELHALNPENADVRQWLGRGLVNLIGNLNAQAAREKYPVTELMNLLARLEKLHAADPKDVGTGVFVAMAIVNVINGVGKLATQGKYPLTQLLKLYTQLEAVHVAHSDDANMRQTVAKGLSNLVGFFGILATTDQYPLDDVHSLLTRLRTLNATDPNDDMIRESFADGLTNMIHCVGELVRQAKRPSGDLILLLEWLQAIYDRDLTNRTGREQLAEHLEDLTADLGALTAHEKYPLPEVLALLDRLQSLYDADPSDRAIRQRLARGLLNLTLHLGVLTVQSKYPLSDLLALLARLQGLCDTDPTDRAVRELFAAGMVNLLGHLAQLTARDKYPLSNLLALLSRLQALYDTNPTDRAVREHLANGLVNLINYLGTLTTEGRYPLADLRAFLARIRELYDNDPTDGAVRQRLAMGIFNFVSHLGALGTSDSTLFEEAIALGNQVFGLVVNDLRPEMLEVVATTNLHLAALLGGRQSRVQLVRAFSLALMVPTFEPVLRGLCSKIGIDDATFDKLLAETHQIIERQGGSGESD